MSTLEESLLSGKNLVSFAHNIAPGLRQDILDCLLYAQLKADESVPHRDDWRTRQGAYQRSLEKNGANRYADVRDQRVKIHHLRDLRKLQLPVNRSPELHQLYGRSLDKLMTSEHAQAFFSSWFTSGRSEHFQVVPCAMHSEDEATIVLCALQMTTTSLRPALYFWQILGGEMMVQAAAAGFRFSSKAFDPYRQAVQDTLSAHAAREILRL